MNEGAARILSSDRIECLAYSFHQCLSCPGTNLAQKILDLRKSLLNRIEVRRVGWEVQSSLHPLPSISSLTLSSLCAPRLSMSTTCPSLSLGASKCSQSRPRRPPWS